jgi:hypothetical protein
MDSEREIMELLESLERFDLDALLKELWDAPLPIIGEPKPRKPRRTRNRNTGKPSKPNT